MSSYYLSDELVFSQAFYAVRGIRDHLSTEEIGIFRNMLKEDVFVEIDVTLDCPQTKNVLWQYEIESDPTESSSFAMFGQKIVSMQVIDEEWLFLVTLCVGFDDPLRRSLPKTRRRFREQFLGAS